MSFFLGIFSWPLIATRPSDYSVSLQYYLFRFVFWFRDKDRETAATLAGVPQVSLLRLSHSGEWLYTSLYISVKHILCFVQRNKHFQGGAYDIAKPKKQKKTSDGKDIRY